MILECRHIYKNYIQGKLEVPVLRDVNFSMDEGEYVAVMGPSGSGKSTLMNLIGCLDQPTSGTLILDGNEVSKLSDNELADLRLAKIGFVFQNFQLLPYMTALENVELALQISKHPMDAKEVLKDVGLEDRMYNFPSQLSGGEQQRVAIARALAKNPKLLLCDEPTGALDYQTGKAILKLLQDTCHKHGMTVIVITHNLAIAPMADRVIQIKNGRVSEMTVNQDPRPVETIEW